MLAAVETSAIGRMFAQKHGYRLDANQELLALGAANLLSGLGRGFPVSGGMSQSLVNESAGARTPVSGLVAALFTLIVVLFASGLLRNLPQPVLAAHRPRGGHEPGRRHALRHIWQFSRTEFAVADGRVPRRARIRTGQRRAARRGISIVLLLRAGSRARGSPNWGAFPARRTSAIARAILRYERVPGVLVVRCESALLYFNVEHVRERVLALLAARDDRDRTWSCSSWVRPDARSRRRRAADWTSQAARRERNRVPPGRGARRGARRAAPIDFERDHGPLETGQTVDLVMSQWQAVAAT